MNKTKIEWCDYTINPIKGICKNNCWYCYARRMYKRFGWNLEIKLDTDCFYNLEKIKESSKIFIGSMHDIFGYWIPGFWIEMIINYCKKLQQHTFIFLTKFPERYKEFPPFSDNCWLGATITGEESAREQYNIVNALYDIDKNIKFLSIEPLLGNVSNSIQNWIDWVIVGGLTPKPRHDVDWVNDIIIETEDWGIPLFLKDNLKWHIKIQEFPNVHKK